MLFSKGLDRFFNKNNWKTANQRLLAKMLAEYTYEAMIAPEVLEEQGEWTKYRFVVSSHKCYQFTAKKGLFENLSVLPDSIYVHEDGLVEEADSAVQLLLDIQPMIGMSPETAGHLIKELNNTLTADVHFLGRKAKTSDELAEEDYERLEGHMTGHPWITYNKGRIGFGYDDYLRFAPESQQEVNLSWIAVHKDRASFQSIEGLDFQQLLDRELDQEDKQRFETVLTEHGVNASDYFYVPIHEWQWKNVIIQQFADDLSNGLIIPLGDGKDEYLPQQSIRTFVNRTHPEKHHVKVPISILNTLVYRGLPAERTLVAPRITAFIKGIYDKDRFLKEECRLILPGEIASINVNHSLYPKLPHAPYQYLEMLGVIWRESIYTYLEDGERAITLAALLHEDQYGKPFIQSLIEKSGLSAEQWMKKFFQIVMDPLLHYLYQYGTVFSPHGQNTILVIKNYKPHRLAVKDFVDDVNISDQPFEELSTLPGELKEVLRSEPPEGLTQFIFTGLFVCHLRYLATILEKSDLVSEYKYWEMLAEAIHRYQARFPHLKARFELFDFFQAELTKLSLNRNRMVDYGYNDGDDRPHASEYGKVKNPLALFAKKTSLFI